MSSEVQLVGFYRQFRNGRLDGPDLVAATREVGSESENRVVGYLESGALLATTGKLVDDVLQPTNTSVAELATKTDGTWAWPAELAYYLAEYHLDLPADFLNHLEMNGFVIPDLDEHELAEVARRFRDMWVR